MPNGIPVFCTLIGAFEESFTLRLQKILHGIWVNNFSLAHQNFVKVQFVAISSPLQLQILFRLNWMTSYCEVILRSLCCKPYPQNPESDDT